MKSLRPISVFAVAVIAALAGWGAFSSARKALRIQRLERERNELIEHIQRLSASRRVAQARVLEQYVDGQGRRISRLLWQEIRPDGIIGLPVEVKVVGEIAYFEALIIKFDHGLVGLGDPERGVSLAMFRRIFGDEQAPESVALFDRAGPVYAAPLSRRENNAAIWDRFWELIEDPELAAAYGVRVAQIEAPAVPLRQGQIWKVTLDAAGGLNVKLAEPSPAGSPH